MRLSIAQYMYELGLFKVKTTSDVHMHGFIETAQSISDLTKSGVVVSENELWQSVLVI